MRSCSSILPFSNYERVETENKFVFIQKEKEKTLIKEIQTYAPQRTILCLNQLLNHIHKRVVIMENNYVRLTALMISSYTFMKDRL